MSIRYCTRPGIEQILPRIEATSRVPGIVRAREAPRVADAGRESLDEDVPEKEAPVVFRHERDDLERFGTFDIREQQKLCAGSVATEQAEVHAIRRCCRSGRKTRAGPSRMRRTCDSSQHDAAIGTQVRLARGFRPQIWLAYSRTARSDENLPACAVFAMDMRVQRSVSHQAALTCC